MSWIYLIIAGLCEVGFTFCLEKAQQATHVSWKWYGLFILSLTTSMFLLMKATEVLPMGIAYVVWTGIGAVGTVLMSVFFFEHELNLWQIFFIALLILAIVGLKWNTA